MTVRLLGALLAVTVLGSCGCATVGPKSIAAGRGPYSEVINKTEDEQVLNAIVRLRYDETFGMMSVTSVTANLRFRAQGGVNVGVGDPGSYERNLVPLSAGVSYEENPTISYVPLSGEDFTRRMLSPITLSEFLMLAEASLHQERVFELVIYRINGLHNPILTQGGASPEFERVVELYGDLRRADVLDMAVVETADEADRRYLTLHDYEPRYGDVVREFLELLGIETKTDGSPILLPIRMGVAAPTDAVHVETRSAMSVLRLFSLGVEVPPSHLEAGIAEPRVSGEQDNGGFIDIRTGEKPPDDATVQVRFRDSWFYVDSTDTSSKRAFRVLRTLIGMRLADPGARSQAPILTVPVN